MGLSFPGTGMQLTKLWENPSPNDDFAATTIYVDTTIYDAVLILQRAGTSLWIPRGQDAVDTTANVWGNGQIGGAFDLKTRRYYAGSGDHITITDCQASAGGSGNWVAQNNWSIPIVIYGVNFGG